jgi:outer membrane protein OmpA-like peptidoglycan-associated protein
MNRYNLGLLALLVFPASVGGQDNAANLESTTQALGGAAQNLQGSIVDLQFNTLDLAFNVEDIGGKTQDLAVKETATEIHIELAADVLFEFDKAVILPKAEETLRQAAAVIGEKAANSTVRIEGHTDAKGDDNYNQKLSERRAKAVKDWFVNKGGLKKVKFKTQGLGEQQPVAPNAKPDGADDPEGRQKNRRVEIIVKKG